MSFSSLEGQPSPIIAKAHAVGHAYDAELRSRNTARPEAFVAKLTLFCKRKGLRIKELCQMVGLPESTFYRWRHGRVPQLHQLKLLSEAPDLGLSFEQLEVWLYPELARAVTQDTVEVSLVTLSEQHYEEQSTRVLTTPNVVPSPSSHVLSQGMLTPPMMLDVIADVRQGALYPRLPHEFASFYYPVVGASLPCKPEDVWVFYLHTAFKTYPQGTYLLVLPLLEGVVSSEVSPPGSSIREQLTFVNRPDVYFEVVGYFCTSF
ncbi:MAG: helix-turn-helix transcriptional regulator [Vampirovibrionales bacterium]